MRTSLERIRATTRATRVTHFATALDARDAPRAGAKFTARPAPARIIAPTGAGAISFA
jgi:hypothetical protein